MRSSVRVVPESLTSWLVMTVTGLADSRFGCGIREPVTMISWALPTGSPAAEVLGVSDRPSTGPMVSGLDGTELVSGGVQPSVPSGTPGGQIGCGAGAPCAYAGNPAKLTFKSAVPAISLTIARFVILILLPLAGLNPR